MNSFSWGSGNGLVINLRKDITTNHGVIIIGHLKTNFSEIWIPKSCQENALAYVVCKMVTILCWPQYVNVSIFVLINWFHPDCTHSRNAFFYTHYRAVINQSHWCQTETVGNHIEYLFCDILPQEFSRYWTESTLCVKKTESNGGQNDRWSLCMCEMVRMLPKIWYKIRQGHQEKSHTWVRDLYIHWQ